jgi:hypothetical protein
MRQFFSRLSRKTLLIGGVVLGVVLLTGIGLAAAAALHSSSPASGAAASTSTTSSTGMKGSVINGLVQVTSINGASLTVVEGAKDLTKNKQTKPVTLTVSSTTKITSYGQQAQLSAIQVDEYVMVRGSDAQHIQQIDILGFGARGTIVAFSDGGLTIHNIQGQEVSFSVGGSTHIQEGDTSVSLTDLQAGETVDVFSQKNSDGSLNAMLVRVDLVHGQVASISGSTISLTSGNKGAQVTVTTTSATKYYIAGQQVAASQLQQNDQIDVAGPGSEKSGVTAAAIFIQEPKVSGKVTGITGSTITIQTKNGATWTVTVSSETKYLQAGQPAQLSDIQKGSMIEASGPQSGDNALTALIIHIAAPKK